jgi:hypothetical protein
MEENLDSFKIIATEGFLSLRIRKVFGYPKETCHWGGYDTQSEIEIKALSYSVKSLICISTGNIYEFYNQFRLCFETLKGKAELLSYEENLKMEMVFDASGHIKILGNFREHSYSITNLQFELFTDQSYLSSMLIELERIYKKYGDQKGIKI